MSRRDQKLWDLGLYEEYVELNQDIEELSIQATAVTRTTEKYQAKIAEAKRNLVSQGQLVDPANPHGDCQEMEEAVKRCQEDVKLAEDEYQSLREIVEEKGGVDLALLVEIKEGRVDPNAERINQQLQRKLKPVLPRLPTREG